MSRLGCTQFVLSRDFPARRRRTRIAPGACLIILLAGSAVARTANAAAPQAESPISSTWFVTIVLPARVVAGQTATLAVLGVDGRLAPGIPVEISPQTGQAPEQHLLTDRTGRASFTVASLQSVLIARASGSSAAALVDANPPAASQNALVIPPTISTHDRFPICATGLRGISDSNRVYINNEPALVVAASPECIVVLPGPMSMPGLAKISVETDGNTLTGDVTFVALQFEPPHPGLQPGQKGQLLVRAIGSQKPLRLLLENETPGVLRFLHGDRQRVLTSGGSNNFASVGVQAVRSGDFQFHARVLAAPDTETARKYLAAAESLASDETKHDIEQLAHQLARHPQQEDKIRLALEKLLAETIPGNLHTLLDAAASAL